MKMFAFGTKDDPVPVTLSQSKSRHWNDSELPVFVWTE
jgi:hypothetical protein